MRQLRQIVVRRRQDVAKLGGLGLFSRQVFAVPLGAAVGVFGLGSTVGVGQKCSPIQVRQSQVKLVERLGGLLREEFFLMFQRARETLGAPTEV